MAIIDGDLQVAANLVVSGIGNISTLSVGSLSANTLSVSSLNVSNFDAVVTVNAASNTTQASTGTQQLSAMTFAGAGLASVGITNGSVLISVGPSSVTINQTGPNIAAGTETGTSGTIVFSNSNGLTFGMQNSSIVTASADYIRSISAGTTNATGNLIVFSNSNGLSFGANGATITAQGPMISFFQNRDLGGSSVITFDGSSGSHAVYFDMPHNISLSFVRIPLLMTTNSTTIATQASATATGSGSIMSTYNVVFYSYGVGANSRSLQSVLSGQALFTQLNSISVTNSTQYSITQAFSANALGAGTTLTTQYSISNTNYSFVTTFWQTQVSSVRFLDIPVIGSLSEGPYWAIFGLSTSSASAGIATGITNCNVRYSAHYGASQANLQFGIMGSTNRTTNVWGAGVFTTAGGGTTNSLNISAISTAASNPIVVFQMIRSE